MQDTAFIERSVAPDKILSAGNPRPTISISERLTGWDTIKLYYIRLRFGEGRKPKTKAFRKKTFKFERDARDRKKLDLDISETGLILEAKKSLFGIMVNEGVDLKEFTSIRIEWGIDRYPEGASWEIPNQEKL